MSSPDARERQRDRLALAVLSVFVLLFYAPLFTGSLLAPHADAANLFLPGHIFAAAGLRAGVWPLWDPYHFMGTPFHAGMQSALFYPLHWPLRLAFAGESTAIVAINATRLLHLLILAWGAYALARIGYGGGPLASAFAGLLLACGAFTWNHLPQINQIVSLSWCPWVVLAARQLATRAERRRWFFALTALMTMGLLAGHPQNLMGAQLFCALAMPAWLWRGGRARAASTIALFVAAGALSLALSAAQWLPTIELARQAWIIGEGPDYAAAIALPARKLWEYFSPYLFGSDLAGRPAYTEGWMHAELGIFFGIIGLVSAWIGLGAALARRDRTLPRPEAVALAAIWLVAIVMALGRATPLFDAALALAPPLRGFRVPARYMLLAHVALTIFASRGIQFIVDALEAHARRLPNRRALRWMPRVALFLLFAELWAASSGAVFRQAPPYFGTPLTSPIWRYLADHDAAVAPGFERPLRAERLFWMIYDDHYLDNGDAAHRVRASQLNPGNNLVYRLEETHGYGESLQPTLRFRDFLNSWHRSFYKLEPDAELLAMMNVRYVLTDNVVPLKYPGEIVARAERGDLPPLTLYRLDRTFPRVFEEGGLRYVDAGYGEGRLADFFDGLWKFNGAPLDGMNSLELTWRERFVDCPPDTPDPAAPDHVGHVEVGEQSFNRQRFRLSATGERLLVAQAAYPGWRVVDGEGRDWGAVRSRSAILQGLPPQLPPGDYTLVFSPGSFHWGVALTAIGWLTFVALFVVTHKRREKHLSVGTE